LVLEKKVQDFLSRAIRGGGVQSAHDCSEGGLLVAALESALIAKPVLGFDLGVEGELPPHRALFGEGPSRILLSVLPKKAEELLDLANEEGIPLLRCGKVTPADLRVVYNGGEVVSVNIGGMFDRWDQALENRLHAARSNGDPPCA